MKKMMAVLLVLAMMLTMTACGSDREKLLGTWETEVEFAEIFNNALGDHEGAEYLKVESLKLKMILTFNEDDTYSMTADAASLDAAMDSLRQTLKAGMGDYLVDTIAATGLNLELGDILHMLDTDLDSMIDAVLTPELLENMVQVMAAEGRFLAEEGKLYLSDSPGKEIDENIFETYIYEEELDTLFLVTPNTIDAYTDLLYPLEFSRVTE